MEQSVWHKDSRKPVCQPHEMSLASASAKKLSPSIVTDYLLIQANKKIHSKRSLQKKSIWFKMLCCMKEYSRVLCLWLYFFHYSSRRYSSPCLMVRRTHGNKRPLTAQVTCFYSVSSAVKEGTEMLELDCHLTQDGHVVVSHDENLLRQTGHNVSMSSLNFQVGGLISWPSFKSKIMRSDRGCMLGCSWWFNLGSNMCS